MVKKFLYLIDSFFIFLCLISLFGGLVYRVYSLNNLGLAISLTLAVIAFIIIQYFRFSANEKNRSSSGRTGGQAKEKIPNAKFGLINFSLLLFYFLLFIFSFYILFSHRTANAIISPWQVLPKYFFLIYALACLLLLANIVKNQKFALPLLTLHYFLSFSIALVIYQLGYGYDPFIHQATEKLIAQIGAVAPKPFYYLGQYSLVVILHKITSLPLVWLDRLLVPLSAAVILPLTLWRVLNVWFNNQRFNLTLILSLLALPLPLLIVTTPQNLAYLLLLVIILLGLVCQNLNDLLLIFLLSLTALIIQPIAGLPALLFCLLLAVYHSDNRKIKPWLYSFLIIAAILILPLSFYLLDKNTSAASESNLIAPAALTKLSLPGQENFILNFLYLYGFNLKIVFSLLILAGVIIAWRYKERCRIFFLYLVMALSLLISYFIARQLPFDFLINYERSDYPARILLMTALFFLPFIIITIYALIEKIMMQNKIFKISWAAFLILLITASLYLTYPRFDNYFNSRGYSVSRADINAVHWINQDAKNDFIVLANQQTSAAALSQFGFKKYYSSGQGQLFYYPIPTSSPLYQYYLDMVYKNPSRQTMLRAMDLVGVNAGYLILNQYWWAFAKVLPEAQLSADSWREMGQGEVYVFKYER
jgi:hypothetical protein